MNESEIFLKQISGILLRSFMIAMALLILWLAIYFVIGNYWFVSHSKLFAITEHELALLNYAGMGLLKIMAFCFLLCPFVAIETVIRFKKK